jgi:hypothetical protein
MLFEMHGLILALHHDARFLRLPGALDRAQRAFEHLLSHYVTSMPARAPRPALRPNRPVRTAVRGVNRR